MEEEYIILETDEALSGSPFKQQAMSDGVPIRNFGISSELWAANQDLASAALFHPFVEALAQGVLPKPAFQKYIAEDAYFLRSFVRGYEAAAAKVDKAGVAPSKAAAATSQLEQLREGVLEELEMHDSYAAKWGVGLSSQTNQSPHPATSKYINFLFSICDDQHSTVAEVLAALVPCLRLYAYLGCTLARSIPESEEYAYAEWIQTYKCQAYIRLPAIAELLLNELALHDSAGKKRVLKSLLKVVLYGVVVFENSRKEKRGCRR